MQHLLRQMDRQLHSKQLEDGERIGGPPRCDRHVEERQFRRAAPERPLVDLDEPGVDPRGIGPQGFADVRILRVDGILREPVQIEPAEEPVEAKRPGAEHLRHPPLHRAPQQKHLPEPVLGVGVAESEVGVRVAFGEHVRHVGAVAHDLHLGGEPLHLEPGVVVGQRPRHEHVGPRRSDNRQNDQRNGNAEQPDENADHDFSIPFECRRQ